MGKVIVINWVTLDGVVQAPGRRDEDTRNGFAHGGWAAAYSDGVIAAKMGEKLSGGFAWLFGHRTYDDLLASWNAQGGPFKDALNATHKYVASRDPSTRLAWPNSSLLEVDAPAAVSGLRQATDTNLVIMGSGELIGDLAAAGVIDEYLLMIAPLVLGSGRRLFDGATRGDLELLEVTPSATGALVASYASAR